MDGSDPFALCFASLLVMMAATPISAFDNNDYNRVFEVIEPKTRSYFDEIVRISKESSLMREDQKKSDIFSNQQGLLLNDILEALSIFNDRQFGFKFKSSSPASNTSDLLTKLSYIDDETTLDFNSNSSTTTTTPPPPPPTTTSVCVKDIGRLIIALTTGQPWAFQFVDAAGKPGPSIFKLWWNFVGNYYQCTDASSDANVTPGMSRFGGGYFTVPLTIVDIPVPVKFGFCLPDTCSAQQVSSLFKQMTEGIPKVLVGKVTQQKVVTEASAAMVIAVLILVVFGTLAIVGTCYDMFYIQGMTILGTKKDLESNEKKSVSYSNGLSLTSYYGSVDAGLAESSDPSDEAQPLILTAAAVVTKPSPKSGSAGKLLMSFSFYTNGKKLLNTSTPEGSLGSIHGIRFLSMTWVMLGHCYLFGTIKNTLNYATAFPTLLHRQSFDAIVNALVSVDTFFALSGLLTSYSMLQKFWRQGLKINWPMVYFHRFWRLTPSYMITLVIFLGLTQYMGSGPFWNIDQPTDKSFCEDNWWTNLLYVNNFVKPKEMCFAHAWYLANDMQFFIMSPLMLIPFYFHRLAGIASCVSILLASWIATGVSSYDNDWQISIFQAIQDPHSNWFNRYYIVPWCRIGPYIMGVLAGYVLAMYKVKGQGRRRRRRAFKIRGWMAALGWAVAVVSAVAVLYGVHGDISGENLSSRSVAALYNTVSRTVWGASVCWVIVACATGYGGPINALLSWSPFVMLGRLTYMTYLIHLPLVRIFFNGMGSLYYFNETVMPIFFLGLLFFCNMLAFVCVLLFESPMIGLEKVLLSKKGKKEKKIEMKFS